uniref:Putative secreted protein n=1 Tax=Anopheles darlingi TaxID=43151 RepID=A0A2M4DJZ7_ANODA
MWPIAHLRLIKFTLAKPLWPCQRPILCGKVAYAGCLPIKWIEFLADSSSFRSNRSRFKDVSTNVTENGRIRSKPV